MAVHECPTGQDHSRSHTVAMMMVPLSSLTPVEAVHMLSLFSKLGVGEAPPLLLDSGGVQHVVQNERKRKQQQRWGPSPNGPVAPQQATSSAQVGPAPANLLTRVAGAAKWCSLHNCSGWMGPCRPPTSSQRLAVLPYGTLQATHPEVASEYWQLQSTTRPSKSSAHKVIMDPQ